MLVVYRTTISFRGVCIYKPYRYTIKQFNTEPYKVTSWWSFDVYLIDSPCWCYSCACLVSTELLWNCLVCCDVLAREYRGFESSVLCSSINKFCCCNVCTYTEIPRNSYVFLFDMVAVVVKYVLGYHTRVGCWEYASRMQIGDCWILCILCVRNVVLLKTCQFDQHRFFCMFGIVTCKFHWLLVYCWRNGGKAI